MPLTTCPDCLKQISNRVEACPFCGCPAQFFSSFTGMGDTFDSISVDNDFERKKIEDMVTQEEVICFDFGENKISYPKCTENIAKLYGKYSEYAYKYYSKYFELYSSVDDMRSVLTELTKKVIEDIYHVADMACEDLFSFGINITQKSFVEKYEIDFRREIFSLYEQYNGVQEEKEYMSYQRERDKMSRGQWQGGGFGIKGAVKGAMGAAILNAGSNVIHSIKDGIAKGADNQYIANEYKELYNSFDNKVIFSNGVYCCFVQVLEGIKSEMSFANIIDSSIFGRFHEVQSKFETIIKYEKNREKLFAGVVQCIACAPDVKEYYITILDELFEFGSDLEDFLKFWNLTALCQDLESEYRNRIPERIKNPFVKNVAQSAIEILDNPIECDDGVKVLGRLIKGKMKVGDSVVLLEGGFCAGFSSVISSIREKNNDCQSAKIGKKYEFILSIKQTSDLEKGQILVNIGAFLKPEADLYVRYFEYGRQKIWGFDDYCISNQSKHMIFFFEEGDKYLSCRGIDFSCDMDKVMNVYGNAKKQPYTKENDIAFNTAKGSDMESVVKALDSASFSLTYSFGNQYVLRFYFADNKKMILVLYANKADVIYKTKSQRIFQVTTKIEPKRRCQKCGGNLKKNVKYCNFCGEPQVLCMKQCSKCGKMIHTEAKYCNYCGEKLKE